MLVTCKSLGLEVVKELDEGKNDIIEDVNVDHDHDQVSTEKET